MQASCHLHRVTVAELAEMWIASRGYSGESARQRRSILRRFTTAMPAEVDAITPIHLVARWSTVSTLAPASRRAHHVAVSCFLGWCGAIGHPAPHLADIVRRPRAPRRAPDVLTYAEVDRLRTAPLTPMQRLTVTLMLDLGLRAVEVSRLRAEDVDHDTGTITVCGKGGHVDTLPLPASIAALVPRGGTGRLYPSGGRPTNILTDTTDSRKSYSHTDPRPGARRGVPVKVRIPLDVLDEIDRRASAAQVARAEMIRRLLGDAVSR